MRVETLVSCVEQDVEQLVTQMHLEQDAVIINQTTYEGFKEVETKNGTAFCKMMQERGVGKSRNAAMDTANTAALWLFSDEDIRYTEGYAQCIVEIYEKHPEADMILFNMEVGESRRTYWNEKWKRIRFYNYGRYPAYSISARKEALKKAGVCYSVWFGGGAKYSNGEDSLFLKDCLKAGLRIYASPVCLGREEERESTWFSGYHEKFFHDRGVLYAFLYGPMKYVMCLVFLVRKRKLMCQQVSMWQAARYMFDGVKEAKMLE